MNTWEQLKADLAFTPQKGKDALRITIAVSLIITIGQSLHLGHYYWGIITVYALARATVGAILMRSLLRLLGTLLGALLGIVTISLFIQQHVFLFVFLALCLFFLCYHGTGKVAPYAFIIAGLTYNIVVVSSYQDPYQLSEIAPDRCLEIAIGIGVMAFCSLTIFPPYAKRHFHHGRTTSLLTLAELHEQAWSSIRAQEDGLERHSAVSDTQLDAVQKLPGLLEQTCAEDVAIHDHRDDLERQIFLLERLQGLSLNARSLLRHHRDRTYLHGMQDDVQALVDAIALALRQLAGSIEQLSTVRLPPELDQSIGRVEAARRRIRESGEMLRFPTDANFRAETYLASLLETASMLHELQSSIHQTSQRLVHENRMDAFTGTLKVLWDRTLHPDSRQVEMGLKGTVTLLITFWLGQTGYLGDWTSTTISALVIIVSGQNVGATWLKAYLRFSGAIVGTFLSILLVTWLLPMATTLPALLLVTFPVFFVVSYLCACNENMNYVGFQAGICLGLTALPYFSQPESIDPVVYRLYGIYTGMVIAWMVTLAFPLRTAHSEVLSHAAQFFSETGERLQQLQPGDAGFAPVSPDASHARQRAHLAAITTHNLTARLESEANSLQYGQASELVHRLNRVESVLMELEAKTGQPMDPERLDLMRDAWEKMRNALVRSCQQLAGELPKDSPTSVPAPDALAQACDTYQTALGQIRHQLSTLGKTSPEQLRTVEFLQQMLVLALRLRDAIELIRSGYDPEVTLVSLEAAPA